MKQEDREGRGLRLFKLGLLLAKAGPGFGVGVKIEGGGRLPNLRLWLRSVGMGAVSLGEDSCRQGQLGSGGALSIGLRIIVFK
jgi:hypothetical protein